MSDYSVGITLSLIDGVSSALTAIGGRMALLNNQATTLNSSLMMIGKGAGLAFVGIQGLQALSAPIEQAQKFQTELARFGTLGFGDKVNNQAAEYARGMKTIGTSTVENMALMGDAMAVFKDLHEAEFAAPIMAKMKFANEALYGKEGGQQRDKALMDMMKVIEFRGGTTSEAEFALQADFAQKAISGSRNRVNPSEMLQALKTGGVGLSRRTNEAFYLQAEPLIQEFGGSRYGTAAMSIYQNLVQARGSIASQQELYRLGLIREDAAIFNKLGKLKKFKAGGMIGSDILETQGEQAFLEQVLLPTFAKKGITGDEAIIREIGMIMGNRTGSALMSRIYQQREKLTMQGQANMQAESLGATELRASETMAGKQIMLHEKWNSLLETLGTNALPLAISATQGLINVITVITDFAQNHPTITNALIVGFTALMASMAIGGTVMMLAGAFRLLGVAMGAGQLTSFFPALSGGLSALAVGIRAAGMALLTTPIGWALAGIAGAAYLIYRNWSTVQPELEKLWNKTSPAIISATKFQYAVILQYFENLKSAAVMLWNGSKNIIPAIASAWAMGKTVIGAIVNATVSYITARWQQSNVIRPIVSGLVSFIVARWQQSNVIRPIVNGVVSFITQKWQSGGELIKGVVSSVVNYIISAFQSIGGAISGMIGSVNAWSNKVISTSGIANTVSNALGIGGKQLDVVAGGKAKATVVHTQINMDGHKVAKVVTHHQSKSANKPMHGTTRHDGNMSPRYVGAH